MLAVDNREVTQKVKRAQETEVHEEQREDNYRIQTVSNNFKKKKLLKNAFGVYRPVKNQ